MPNNFIASMNEKVDIIEIGRKLRKARYVLVLNDERHLMINLSRQVVIQSLVAEFSQSIRYIDSLLCLTAQLPELRSKLESDLLLNMRSADIAAGRGFIRSKSELPSKKPSRSNVTAELEADLVAYEELHFWSDVNQSFS